MVELNESDVFQGKYPLEKIVDELEEMFPTFLPAPNHNLSDIMFRSGQRSVVEYLITKLEE